MQLGSWRKKKGFVPREQRIVIRQAKTLKEQRIRNLERAVPAGKHPLDTVILKVHAAGKKFSSLTELRREVVKIGPGILQRTVFVRTQKLLEGKKLTKVNMDSESKGKVRPVSERRADAREKSPYAKSPFFREFHLYGNRRLTELYIAEKASAGESSAKLKEIIEVAVICNPKRTRAEVIKMILGKK